MLRYAVTLQVCTHPKAADTHSENIILIFFLLQHWLRERALVLRHTHIVLFLIENMHTPEQGVVAAVLRDAMKLTPCTRIIKDFTRAIIFRRKIGRRMTLSYKNYTKAFQFRPTEYLMKWGT